MPRQVVNHIWQSYIHLDVEPTYELAGAATPEFMHRAGEWSGVYAEAFVVIEPEQTAVAQRGAGNWPREVEMILSAMDAGLSSPSGDRRSSSRSPHRTQATLKLYADPADAAPRILYTRDADPRCAGFITQNLLPLGYGGWVTLIAPNGEEVHAECTIYRCRKTVQGWYEGAMRFNREVWQLAGDREGEPAHIPYRGLRLAH